MSLFKVVAKMHLTYMTPKRITLFFLLIIIFFIAVPADAETLSGYRRITGEVIDEYGKAVNAATLKVDNKTFTVKNGRFSIPLNLRSGKLFIFESDRHYPGAFAFDEKDLRISNNAATLPTVTLVSRKKGRVMFTFTGDAMMGRRFAREWRKKVLIRKGSEAEDAKKILRHMMPITRIADFSVCNFESPTIPYKPSKRHMEKLFTFYSHPGCIDGFKWAGFDYLALGNNHQYDYLDLGVRETIKYMTEKKMPFSGIGLNEHDAMLPYRITLNGSNYSILSFVGWESGNWSPKQTAKGEHKAGAALGTVKTISAAVKQETDKGFFPIVEYHGGAEFSLRPGKSTIKKARAAIDNGAQLFIGHHPHVTHGFEIYKDRLIAYSMGNFVFDQWHFETYQSFIIHVWMDGNLFHRAEIVPIYIKRFLPRPATGNVRNHILKMTSYQSSKLGVTLTDNAGHGVITPPDVALEKKTFSQNFSVALNPAKPGFVSLRDRSWNRTPIQIKSKQNGVRFKLGKEILLFGDFEDQDADNTKSSRTWRYPKKYGKFTNRDVHSGRSALSIQHTAAGSTAEIRFAHKVKDRSRRLLTLTGYVKAKNAGRIRGKLRFWKTNSKEAADGASFEIAGGTHDWKQFQVDFKLPKGYHYFRPYFYVDPPEQGKGEVIFDDIAVVSWEPGTGNLKDGFALKWDSRNDYLRLESDKSQVVDLVVLNSYYETSLK